jgi:hypothetical protein
VTTMINWWYRKWLCRTLKVYHEPSVNMHTHYKGSCPRIRLVLQIQIVSQSKCCWSRVELQIHDINPSGTKTRRFSSYRTVNKIYVHYRNGSFNSTQGNNHSLFWETYRIHNYTLWQNVEFLSVKPCGT